MNSSAGSNAAGNARTFRSISYTLVFLMISCIILTISVLIQNVAPGWHSGVMAGVMLLILIDRLLMHERFKSLPALSSEWLVAFAAQWIVFAIFIRLLLSYADGLSAFLRDLSLFARGDLAELFSPEYIVTLLLAAFAWFIPALFLDLLDEIGLDQEIALRESTIPVQSDAVPAHQRLVHLIFNLGIFLVVLAAMTLVDVRATFSDLAKPSLILNRFSAAQGGILLYFIFGLALLSQGRLMSLQTRWNIQRIPIASDNLARKWGLYSLVFLFLIVLAVSLLPTGDSLGIFSLLATLIGFLLGLLIFLAQVFLVLLALLFSLPLLLLGVDSLKPGRSPLPPPVMPPAPDTPPLFTLDGAIWEVIRSVLLWGGLILIVFFSVRRFLRQHDDFPAALRRAPILGWLVLLWEWLRTRLDTTGAALSRAVAEGWQSIVSRFERRRSLPGGEWLSFRPLDPRRRVYFFYHAMMRHSAREGLSRKPSQTPSEYAGTLEKGIPSAGEDVEAITGAFIEARYSRHEVDMKQADEVKTIWGRIRRALRKRPEGLRR